MRVVVTAVGIAVVIAAVCVSWLIVAHADPHPWGTVAVPPTIVTPTGITIPRLTPLGTDTRAHVGVHIGANSHVVPRPNPVLQLAGATILCVHTHVRARLSATANSTLIAAATHVCRAAHLATAPDVVVRLYGSPSFAAHLSLLSRCRQCHHQHTQNGGGRRCHYLRVHRSSHILFLLA